MPTQPHALHRAMRMLWNASESAALMRAIGPPMKLSIFTLCSHWNSGHTLLVAQKNVYRVVFSASTPLVMLAKPSAPNT